MSGNVWSCGWGGVPQCPEMLPSRGLCNEHAGRLREIAEAWHPARRQPRVTAKKPAAEDKPEKLPVAVRAASLARAVHAANGTLSRDQAAAAAGLKRANGSLSRVIAFAKEQRWIDSRTGPHGGYLPGPTTPPKDDN